MADANEIDAGRDAGSPILLTVPHDAASDNNMIALNALQKAGFEPSKEYSNDYQTVYTVQPQPERSKAPAKRGGVNSPTHSDD